MTALDAEVRRLTLGRLEQIPPGEGRTFTIGTTQVAVFRLRDGTVRALDAVCPHRGGPLADGQTDAQVVLCPLHLNAFELSTGRCLTGGPDTRAYPVAVDDDQSIVLSLPTVPNSA